MTKKKINVTISEELYKWCSDRSKEYGMSIPSLFVFAMAQYKEQSMNYNKCKTVLCSKCEQEKSVKNK